MGTGFSRRRFFGRAALTGAALAAPSAGTAAAQGIVDGVRGSMEGLGDVADSPDVHEFVTRPDLHPPRVTVAYGPVRPPGYVFMAPKYYLTADPGPGQGCLITDNSGEPVWVAPGPGGGEWVMNFHPGTYRGRPVVSWWHGAAPGGHGYGSVTIADEQYRTVAEVHAGRGEAFDFHDQQLTAEGTLLATVYSRRPADLRPVGGPADGWVNEGVIQEIAVDTGAVVMEWRSLPEVPVDQTYFPFAGDMGTAEAPFDYIHLNSVRVAPDGNLIVSARHTCTVYKIARDGSRVLWRLGGKVSDFDVPADARFAWQHDAELHPDGTLSLFDNDVGSVPGSELGLTSPPAPSSGLVLDVDEGARIVGVRRRLYHPAALNAETQGSVQLLPDGSVFVGWGSVPYATLYDPAGIPVWDARIGEPWQSYRARVDDWAGMPDDAPVAAALPGIAGETDVYASWNGATRVTGWRILAGPAPDALRAVQDVPRAGFETAAHVRTGDGWFAVAALDGDVEIGRSAPVAVAS